MSWLEKNKPMVLVLMLAASVGGFLYWRHRQGQAQQAQLPAPYPTALTVGSPDGTLYAFGPGPNTSQQVSTGPGAGPTVPTMHLRNVDGNVIQTLRKQGVKKTKALTK